MLAAFASDLRFLSPSMVTLGVAIVPFWDGSTLERDSSIQWSDGSQFSCEHHAVPAGVLSVIKSLVGP